MISPSFVEEVERQRSVAQADLEVALAHGDESAAAAAQARLADLEDISARAAEMPRLVA